MIRAIGGAIVLALVAVPAYAHDPIGSNNFWSGLLHPWLVTPHALALTGLALLSSRQPARRLIVLAFAAGLLGGFSAIAQGIGETPAPLVIFAVAALAGALAAAAWALPAAVGIALGLAGGAAIALDSPPQAVRVSTAFLIQLGTGLGALVPLALVAEIAARARRGRMGLAIRVLGAWVAASAILVLALRIAR